MTLIKGWQWGRSGAICCALLLLCSLLGGMTPSAYAAPSPTPALVETEDSTPEPTETKKAISEEALKKADDNANALITGEDSFLGQVAEFYKMIRKVAVGLCLCSIVCILIPTFWANQSNFEKNIRKIFMIMVALGAFYLIPYAIQVGLNIAKSMAWRPGNI